MPELKTESSETKTRAKAVQEKRKVSSRWERFPAAVAELARQQSTRLYRYLDRALDGPKAVNLQSQFASVPQDDGIGAWIALLRWNTSTIGPAREREEALDDYYSIQLKPHEHPESFWTRLEITREKLTKMKIDLDEGATERRFVKAINQSRHGHLYYQSIQHHQLAERQGKEPTCRDLRTALTFRYEELQRVAPVVLQESPLLKVGDRGKHHPAIR